MNVLIDRVVNCFGDCTTVPEEQCDYFTWIPLYQDEDCVEWSDVESDIEEERAKTEVLERCVVVSQMQHAVVYRPELMVLYARFFFRLFRDRGF